MTRRRSATVTVAALGLAFAAVLGGASAAFAHDSLVDAAPAQGATVSSLDELKLTFSGDLLGADTGADQLELIGPDGGHYEADCAAVSDATLTAPVALGDAGIYEVLWRVVSSDGHPVSGDYTFTYAPASDQPVAAGAAVSSCASDARTDATPTAVADDGASAPAPSDDGLVAGLIVGGVVIVGVAVVVTLILRSRRD